MAESWADAPCVFVVLPTCPDCGGGSWVNVRTEQNGDGSRTRKCVCRRCSGRFKIVAEPLPDSGNCDLDVF